MSDWAPREKETEIGRASSAPRVESAPLRTPGEHANDSIALFSREMHDLEAAVAEVRDAHAANDLEHWTNARTRVESMLCSAGRSVERARGRANSASAEMQARLASAESVLEQQRAAFGALTEAPTGFTTVSTESEILAAFHAPLEGGFRIGFEKKEVVLRARFDRLPPAERRVLAERLRKARPNDPIANAFSRLTEARRRSLLEHLASAGERRSSPADAESLPVIEPEALDTRLRRILDTGDSEPAIESAFCEIVADLDGTARRALARRLETYRPGTGDDVAARFVRLDRALRQRVCTALRSDVAGVETLPDPIRGELEAATGTSLGHVRLHADAHGSSIADAHGARAVAIGSDIYMGEGQLDPTTDEGRELIAHEVAHVVQARGRTSTAAAKRDADSTETAEVEADDFAARFREQGGAVAWTPSAEVASGTPMHAPSQPSKETPGVTAAMYLYLNAAQFYRVLRARLGAIEPALPSSVTWRSYGKLVTRMLEGFEDELKGFDPQRAMQLRDLTSPLDVYEAIDRGRIMLGFDKRGASHPGDVRFGAIGRREWSDAAGRAFATVVETAFRRSIARLAGNLLATARRKGGSAADLASTELVLSHPMDRLIATALPTSVEIASTPANGGGEAGTFARTSRAANGLRLLDKSKFEWQHAKDPSLWNWIKVSEADATAEEVANALWGGKSGAGSVHAHRLTAMAPYFGIPEGWARKMPGAAEHAPTSGNATDATVTFAASTAAEDLALAQAGSRGDSISNAEIERVTQQSRIQLDHMDRIASAWGYRGQLEGARRFAAMNQLLGKPPTSATSWGHALRDQQEILYDVATQLDAIHTQFGSKKQIDPHAAGVAPYREVVGAFVKVASTSHLAKTSRALWADALDKQRMLVARVVTDAVRGTEASVDDMRGVAHDKDANQITADKEALVASSAKLESDVLAGRTPDAADVDEMLVSADELALKSHLRGVGGKLVIVEKAALDANKRWVQKGANLPDADIWTLPGRAGALKAKLETVRAHLDGSIANLRLIALDDRGRVDKTKAREGRRAAIAAARAELSVLQKDTTIQKFFQDAYETIEDAQTRALIFQIALLIGISIASAGIGSAFTTGARGVLAARSAHAAVATVQLSRTALVATRVGGLAVESALTTAGQAAVLQKPVGATFLEDFLTNLATSGILQNLRSANGAAKASDDMLRAFWKRSAGHVVIAKGVQLTGEMLVGAATSYVVQMAAHAGTLEPQTVTQWYAMGASMAVGRFVHGVAGVQLERLETITAKKGWQVGRALSEEVRALQTAAAKLEQAPDHQASLDLLRRRGELLRKEQVALETIAKNPKLAHELGTTAGALEALRHDNASNLADHAGRGTRNLILEGAGLRRTIGDKIWSGDDAEVARALNDAAKAGFKAEVTARTAESVRIAVEGTEVEVKLVTSAKRPTTAELASGYRRAKAAAGGATEERIPAEVIQALSERLPDLRIDPADPKPGIEAYLRRELGADLVVESLGGGASGAQVFRVKDRDGHVIHVFKIFRSKDEMLREIAALTTLRDARLKIMHPVGIDHAANVTGGKHGPTGGALMEAAQGTIVKDQLKAAGKAAPGSPERAARIEALQRDVVQVAKGMAEMHTKLRSGAGVSRSSKESEVFWFEDKWRNALAQGTVPERDQARVEPLIKEIAAAFLVANLDGTIVHGDGHIGNFAVQGERVATFDTETLFRSIGADGKGAASAATDVGRFHESIAIQGKELGVGDAEITLLQRSFLDAYRAAFPQTTGNDFNAAMTFYEANYDLIHIRSAAVKARADGKPIDRSAIERLYTKAKGTR